jgi:nucleoside-diphosphate-sugar epimerase
VILPIVYGGFLHGFPTPATTQSLGAAWFPYVLIGDGAGKQGTWPFMVHNYAIHVRDVAQAITLALFAPPLKDGRKKRLLIAAGPYTWAKAAELVKKERPELADRLPKEGEPVKQLIAPMDLSLSKEVLGLEYIPWEKAILDTIDSCLKWERTGEF